MLDVLQNYYQTNNTQTFTPFNSTDVFIYLTMRYHSLELGIFSTTQQAFMLDKLLTS